MRIRIEFDVNNDAFMDGDNEIDPALVATQLNAIAHALKCGELPDVGDYLAVRDVNGNHIGELTMESDG